MKKLEDCSILEIQEHIKSIANEETTNCYLRCLECGEYVHIKDIEDLEQEICSSCQEEKDYWQN